MKRLAFRAKRPILSGSSFNGLGEVCKMPNRNSHGYLYFIASREQNAVKVGFADNINQRFANLQSGNPAKLSIYGVIPVEGPAETVFHSIMKPHRIVREWYPDDALLTTLAGELIEEWGDKVQEIDGSLPFWAINGDEYKNPARVFLPAADMRRHVTKIIADFFAMTPDDWESEDGSSVPNITNHWAVNPPKRRASAPRPRTVHG
jgi:hypothetical protein